MRARSKKMASRYEGPKCKRCDGTGEDKEAMPSIVCCPGCGGTGKTEGRREFVARILKERPLCEAGKKILEHLFSAQTPKPFEGGLLRFVPGGVTCAGEDESEDVHEILARSAGGDILDEQNVLAVCRCCHDWIGRNPKEALSLGLRRSRYAGRNP